MSEVCPFCNTENIYFSKKRNKYFCEECLQEFELEDTKKSVFFSYGHDKNAIFVKKLKDDLEQKGYTVWIDESEIKVGEDWRNKITTGIMKSNNVLVFLSEHSTRNPGVCLDEIKIALCVKNGNIHTVLVEDEKKVNPPASITNIQWLDATRWYKYYQTPLFDEWYNGILEQIAEIIETNRNDSFEGQISYINNFLKPIYSNSKEQRLLSLDLID